MNLNINNDEIGMNLSALQARIGIAFAVYIVHRSLEYQFEHSADLARCDEPGLNLALRNSILHCQDVRPHSSVLR